MSKLKKYWIEIILIVGYLISDNLHMIIEHYNYSPEWYISPWLYYKFNDSIFYLFHYFAQMPVMMTFVLLLLTKKDITMIYLRSSMLMVSLCDFTGEFSETFNLNFTLFTNEGYTHFTLVKIFILCIVPFFAIKMKKACMNILKLFTYG